MKLWVEVIPVYDYEWSVVASGARPGKVFKKRPKRDVLAAGRIIEVDIALPTQFLTPRVRVDLF